MFYHFFLYSWAFLIFFSRFWTPRGVPEASQKPCNHLLAKQWRQWSHGNPIQLKKIYIYLRVLCSVLQMLCPQGPFWSWKNYSLWFFKSCAAGGVPARAFWELQKLHFGFFKSCVPDGVAARAFLELKNSKKLKNLKKHKNQKNSKVMSPETFVGLLVGWLPGWLTAWLTSWLGD